jgi:transposase-like protein
LKNSKGGLELNTREVTRQYRLNQWTEIIRECRNSGQTISAWCAAHNVNSKSYYYWLKLVRTAAFESLPPLDSTKQQLIPVKIPAQRTETEIAAQESTCAITLSLGSVTMKLHNGASATLIENTLRALENVR